MKTNICLSDLCDPLKIKKEFKQTMIKAIHISWGIRSITDILKACREVPAQQGEHEQHILEAAASNWTQEIWLKSPSNKISCGRPGHCSDYRDQNFSWLPYLRRGHQISLGEEIKHCLHWGKSSRTLHSSLNHTRIRPDISYLEAQFFSALHINLKPAKVLVVHQCDNDLKLEASRISLVYQKSLVWKFISLPLYIADVQEKKFAIWCNGMNDTVNNIQKGLYKPKQK